MSQEYKCISSKAVEVWECSDSSLEVLSPADVLLSWLEPSVRSQLPSNWPAAQTSSAYVHLKCMPVCNAKLGQHFGWLLGSWLRSLTTSFLFCYYPDSPSGKCSIFIWHICTWSFSMCVCLGIYSCFILLSLQRLLPTASSKMKSRERPNEVKMLHSKFIIVFIGPSSGKYLSMCLSPIEINRT